VLGVIAKAKPTDDLMPVTGSATGLLGYFGPGDIPGMSWAGWWGFRAFTRTAIGRPVCNLRRSSDGATQTFSSVLPDGGLDATAINTFKGAGTLSVVTIFDQSGNNRDMLALSQSTEGRFTTSAPNGRYLLDNLTAPNSGMQYRTGGTVNWGSVTPRSFYSTYRNSNDVYQSVLLTDWNGGDGMYTNPNTAFHSDDPTTHDMVGIPGYAVRADVSAPNGSFHCAVAMHCNSNPGANAIISADTTNNLLLTDTSNEGEGDLFISTWGGNGFGALDGYGAETGWAQPINWHRGQVAAILSNSRGFWGF